ncbi:MAG: ABC transporter ATP-binding protein/permease [candidate division KSB1 bacterium]|nr:ABC transporter ATP-binding protein/permease [candidate division KSB1 bacterium]MDZ7301558.1 ABC transporter ATP-binding protein/permease [candidate division KSB1 bacterium]MDZ7311026.1 ABC transporter ATP-binding protein/permease [candidate division KSB1 bacterium]
MNKKDDKGRLGEIRELRTLLPYLRKYRKQVGAGVLFIIITNVFSLLGPRVLRYAIDSLAQTITSRRLLYFGGLILLVSLAEGFFRYWMRQTIIVVSRLIEYDLRNDYFRHLQRMSRNFFNRISTGDLMARATNDLSAVRSFLGPGIMYSTNTIVVGTGAFVLMLSMNVKLTLLAMLPLPLMAFTVNRAMDKIHKIYEDIQAQFSKLTTRAQENLSGIRVIKAYQRERYEIDTFRDLNRDYFHKNLRLIKVEGILWSMMGLLSGLGALALLWLGGREVIRGNFTWGEFVAFYAYMSLLIWPMIALGWVINLMQQGTASMGRINRILHEEPDIKDDAHTDFAIQKIRGEIEFQNVGVSYPGRDWSLRHINLKIPAGSTVAVVGHTGSGKSTLVNLIPRMIEPTEGRILIDGVDLRRIPLQVLRRAIGYVPQETFLFSDTIRENITFGLENGNGATTSALDGEMITASTIAQIRKEIEGFSEKFDTMLGERGINLSGGQKQRVAIARAIIRQPRILILDDALSSVDTYTEEEILRGLRDVMRERTSIIISHRVSTVKDADVIVVLKDGRIAEKGSHELLLQRDGLYAELYRQQQLEEDLATLE